MKICIPLAENRGELSTISEHFGSAPFFMIHDLGSKTTEIIDNANSSHDHGTCNPLSLLSNYNLDSVICCGIGQNAIQKLKIAGIKVFLSSSNSAPIAINDFTANKLSELTMEQACAVHDCH